VKLSGPILARPVNCINARVTALANSPRWGRRVSRHIATITYTGRRSGRTFSTPIGYRRHGDTLTIPVTMPEAKSWWRNFLDEGGPVSLRLEGTDRAGHAVSRRDERGRVTVTVHLDQSPPAPDQPPAGSTDH